MKSESFMTRIYSNATTMFKDQKSSKDIVKKNLLVFFVQKKYSCIFIKLQLNHWCHMDYFIYVLTTFLGLEHGSSFAVYAGSESSRISSKISSFVLQRWTKVLQVWNDMRVNN